MNKKFIFRRAISAVLAVAMIAASLPFSSFAEDGSDSPTFSSDAANSLMKNTVPAGYDKTTNPYGYDVDHPFAMVEQNELIYFETYTGRTTGKIADVGTANSLQSFISNSNTASDSSLPNVGISAFSNYAYMQAVAFDPYGTGRRDHIVYVGLNRGDRKVYAHVYDAVNNRFVGSQVVGEMEWIYDNKGNLVVENYYSNNLITVAAGDFDNDGKDTIIVYVPNSSTSIGKIFDVNNSERNNNLGCFIKEYSFDNGTLTMRSNTENSQGYNEIGDRLLHDEYIKRYHTQNGGGTLDYIRSSDSEYNHIRKLYVRMRVGDFNGDGIDDLAVLSLPISELAREENLGYLTPQLKIKYGTRTGYNSNLSDSIVDQRADEVYNIMDKTQPDSNGKYSATTIDAVSLVSGDFNNDGYEDLAVVGVEKSGTVDPNNSISAIIGGLILQNEEKFAYSVLLNNHNKGFVQGAVKTMNSNKWTQESCDDKIVLYTTAEAVAFDGSAVADYLFLNGSIYTYSATAGQFDAVSSRGYSVSGFQFTDGLGGKEELFRSVAVGNFDGNTAGREQIVFIASCRDKDDVYSFKKGMITGVYSDSNDDYGTATGFKTTIQSNWGPNNANGGNYGCGAQVLLTACDRDQDGVIARYKGVSYAYSDPEVKAVMQAAPYFAALGDSANNETDYTITESYELEQSSSKNVSYSVGMSYKYGGLFAPFELEISAGYSLEWSKSFSEALETEYAMTVKAQAYNTALVARTPVFVYCYEVLDKNGAWSDETAISLSIPQQPVYQQMSIDDYNSFAEEYNSYMEKKGNRAITKESDKTSKDEACYYRLEKINEAENWLDGNEGNPYMYNQLGWGAYSALGAQQLSQNTIRLGYAGGLNEVSYSKSNIKSVSEEISHGFYFNFSISFGVFGDGILFSHDIGFETSLSYSNGSGVSTTKTSSQGCIGAVNDIDGPTLAEEGIPASIYTQYTFDWTLGQWFRHLYGEEGNKTVFIGYSLSNVSTPAPAVDDLEAELFADDAVRLTWSQPDKTPGWPEVEGYYVYSVENGEYTKISDLLSADTTSYDIENIKTNTDFSFVVTSVCKMDGKEKESAWSNIAEVTTAKRDYKVNYSVDNKNAADIKVRHLGNVEIKSGDEISESEIIKVKVTPKSGQYELVSLTLDNGGESMIFTPEADGTIECAFTLNGEANIQVSTERAVTSAQVTFTDTYTADGAVIGTVSATVGDAPLSAPGGTVTDDVTFAAVPKNGYGLKSWKITDADNNTVTIDAAGSDTYTLRLASKEYTVEAEFASLSEIGKQVKVNIPAEGGTIEITDANGDIIELNDNNSVYVPVDCELTFTVKADADCKFRAWTGDAEGQSGESFTMTITKDTEIGAEFDVPVRLTLTYSAASGDQTGAVATKQGYQSGTGVIVGTKIVLTAQAAENYRVQKLVITRDDKVDTVTTDDKLYSQYDYEIVMDTKTDIQVYFTEIEQYTVTIDSIQNADMTVKNGNEDFVSGNTIRYGDEITVTVKPNENYRLADTASWIDNNDGSYTYKTGAVKANTNISVKIEKIPEYTVTFPTTIEGCILSVKNGKEKISSGDKLLEGTQLTATVTLDPTFILKGWYIGGEFSPETNKTEVSFTVDGDTLLSVIVENVKGDKGDTGIGIKSAIIDESGNLIITLTDDTVLNLGKVTGDNGSQGEQGVPGAAGVGVKSAVIDKNGNLVITLTDNTVHNLGKVVGDKGEQGMNGVGVKSVMIDESGNLIITLTDETVHNAGRVTGDKGDKGDTGNVGVGVKTTEIDENGNLIITLTDDTVHNLGKVVGAKGEAGTAGTNGINGTGIKSAHIDADGNLILTFTDGVITNLGKIVGTDGKDGVNGKDGTNGKDGKDGKDGLGIKGCRIDDGGDLIITLTDNTTLNAGNISAISDKVSVSKPLATAAVSLSGVSLLWNIVSLVAAIVRKKKLI